MARFMRVCVLAAGSVVAAWSAWSSDHSLEVSNGSVPRSSYTVMAYNLQNLFDTKDNPNTSDEEFLPSGKQRWTETVIADKIRNLSEVIRAENPDILGVVEVENQEMLERLVREGLKGMGYELANVIASPSDDGRGIRTGIISRFPVLRWTHHRVWKDSWKRPDGSRQTTRDILEVTVKIPSRGGRVESTFLVNHWPSRAGGPSRAFMRLEAAQKMAEVTQNILQKNPKQTVVAMGDFNDERTDSSFVQGLELVKSWAELLAGPVGVFFPTGMDWAAKAASARGTYYFGLEKQWNEIDQILVSLGQDVLQNKARGFRYVQESLRRTSHRFVGKHLGEPLGCELGYSSGRSQDETHCPYGASDHYPIAADFEIY